MSARDGSMHEIRLDAAWSTDELVISQLARIFPPGEYVATGATMHSFLAAQVAKLLYNPDLILVGGTLVGFDCAPGPKLLSDEFLCGESALGPIDWMEYFDMIAADRFRIVLGPVQIDAHGNSNISLLGDPARPAVQLVGSRGIPDDVVRISEMFFHVRRHTPRSFVERVDFICGLGYGERREALGLTMGRPSVVVSDLGVFGFEGNQMVIRSLHPGVTSEMLQERTGFIWPEIDGPVPLTPPPTSDELRCIRETVDPFGARLLEDDRSGERFARLVAEDRMALRRVIVGV